MTQIATSSIESPIGDLRFAVSEEGLIRVALKREAGFNTWLRGVFPSAERVEWLPMLDKASQELGEYFSGRRRDFTVPLSLHGTEFQRAVWDQLLQIPFGTTCSYADIARRVGRPKAFRAVGMANNANPLPIVVPCHRVIGADGSLGGFGGGLDAKRRLLAFEKSEAADALL